MGEFKESKVVSKQEQSKIISEAEISNLLVGQIGEKICEIFKKVTKNLFFENGKVEADDGFKIKTRLYLTKNQDSNLDSTRIIEIVNELKEKVDELEQLYVNGPFKEIMELYKNALDEKLKKKKLEDTTYNIYELEINAFATKLVGDEVKLGNFILTTFVSKGKPSK